MRKDNRPPMVFTYAVHKSGTYRHPTPLLDDRRQRVLDGSLHWHRQFDKITGLCSPPCSTHGVSHTLLVQPTRLITKIPIGDRSVQSGRNCQSLESGRREGWEQLISIFQEHRLCFARPKPLRQDYFVTAQDRKRAMRCGWIGV